MKKRYVITLIAVLLAVFGSLAWVGFIRSENVWICEDGEWIRHGEPKGPAPEMPCVADDNDASGSGMEAAKEEEIFENTESEFSRVAASCSEDENGRFLSLFRECEYASESWCSENGGVFDICASPCRNDEDRAQASDTACAEVCIPVCFFPEL